MTSPPIGRPSAWTEQAACAQSDLPVQSWDADQPPHINAEAILVCNTCPVALECLLEHGRDPDMGIIAGLPARKRGELFAITNRDLRPVHGSRSRYMGSSRWPGCRCGKCRDAHAKYEQEARARRKAGRATA
ncbi:WhiB family transcriptional regulator [Cumulibacter soli]|uniref:WhiB family transcriptional regulator n=1 Tax=Cumulibacter soli TaxID=2546344 RepID=UPI001067DDB4